MCPRCKVSLKLIPKFRGLFPNVPQVVFVPADPDVIEGLLSVPLNELGLSARAFNALKAGNVVTLGDLVQYNRTDLLKFRNMGERTLKEIENIVRAKGLSLGFEPYKR